MKKSKRTTAEERKALHADQEKRERIIKVILFYRFFYIGFLLYWFFVNTSKQLQKKQTYYTEFLFYSTLNGLLQIMVMLNFEFLDLR